MSHFNNAQRKHLLACREFCWKGGTSADNFDLTFLLDGMVRFSMRIILITLILLLVGGQTR
jgi:hypothetical protein